MLDDLSLFVRVVQEGSFLAAARAAELSTATLTRRIQNLETRFNCQLLNRSARGVSLTPIGQRLYESTVAQVESLQTEVGRLHTDTADHRGRIRLIAPINLTHHIVQPLLQTFLSENPGIQLSILLSNDVENLAERQADLALRFGNQIDSGLRQKFVGEFPSVLVATPEVARALNGAADMQALLAYPCIASLEERYLVLQNRQTGARSNLAIEPHFHCNDLDVAIATLESNGGFMHCPYLLVREHLASGRLIRIMPEWEGENRRLYMVWNSRNLLMPRTQLLLNFLVEQVGAIGARLALELEHRADELT
ncbi:LysR family transcriptional regulator [Marinobacterium lutimaris]|uniref:LysR family transcriptional regulator, transcriptional activator AphB n=1 Tax=Marinobacterium lutimaris TaxID=568106 RepID=A0A1H5YY42_9GAMM|nr:LysR family transcriptional regulator [Marinobacterium lutimaris]SEG28958.1 LysR family transcriptional regulator, transcriptional activator AphB [Marinobacterium lutimaris]